MPNSGFLLPRAGAVKAPEPPTGPQIIRVLAGVEPGWWWDAYILDSKKENRCWLGVVQGTAEEAAAQLKKWWPQMAGHMELEEKYKKLPVERRKLRKTNG